MKWLLFLALVCAFAVDGGAAISWYKGCYIYHDNHSNSSEWAESAVYHGNSSKWAESDVYHGNSSEWTESAVTPTFGGSVVECGQFCLSQRYEYMGIRGAELCSCYNLTGLQHRVLPDPPEYCNISCINGSDFPLPCGGAGFIVNGSDLSAAPVSVYATAGPYLTDVTLKVDADWLVVDTPLVIEASAHLQAFVNISDAWADSSRSGLISEFTWSIAGQVRVENVTAQGRQHRCRIPFTFTHPGQYTIDVLVRNVLSQLQENLTVRVIPPEPKDLQVALLTEEEHLPSCIPKHCNLKPKSAVVAVFCNTSVQFEASVSVGKNLTFVLEFSDDAEIYEFRPAFENPQCEERNCTAVVQRHVFRASGVYELTVTVDNVYGSVQRNLTVVVVNHGLSNLSVALRPGSPNVVSPLQPVTLLVKVETASRRDTSLLLLLGNNNNTRSFTVQEFNTSSLVLTEPDRAAIAASYGDGCLLEVEVEHVFMSQGVFTPVLWAYNNVSQINATSPDHILVINRLQGPKLHPPTNAGQNRSSTFHLDLDVKSVNMTVTWTISTRTGDLVDTRESSSLSLEYVFPSPGHFNIKATATNILGNVSTSASVYVQVPVAGLTLSPLPDRYYGKVGHTVSCFAEVESGSDVIFTWYFQDLGNHSTIMNKNMSSIANHTYFHPGRYNVTVSAANSVNIEWFSFPELFVIQQPVKVIVVQCSRSTSLGSATTFRVAVNQASSVKFDFDFGTGRHPGRGGSKGNYHRLYFMAYEFSTAGVHLVQVFAFNLVSEVVSEISVVVEKAVPQFSVEVVGSLIINHPVVLAAMKGGDVIQRLDLIYLWETGNVTLITRSPLMTFTFETPGIHNVTLTASNSLESSEGEWSTLRELWINADDGRWTLSHCGVAQLGDSCSFSIQGNISSLGNVTVQHNSGQSSPDEVSVDPSGWSWVFERSGLHRVSARGQAVQLDTYCIVQEAILGLHLQGPIVVPLQSLSRRYVWEAVLEQGSHAIYVWTLENNRSLPSTYNEFVHIFTRGGTYTLHVEVFNDVSRATTNLTILAQHPIVDVETMVTAVVHGQSTDIMILVEGGREFFLHIDFGDRSSQDVSSENGNVRVESVPVTGSEPASPQHRVLLSHRYDAIGEYSVYVNVSNRLAWKDQSKTAKVDEPIAGILLETDSPSVIRLRQLVVVRATVASGKDLSFDWEFSDNTDTVFVSNHNSSEATHKYTVAGTYNVSVLVSNPLYKTPVTKHLDFVIQAMSEIKDLNLQRTSVAPLLHKHGNWSADVDFIAECFQCSNVTFLFDFGDNTRQNATGQLDSFGFAYGVTVRHRYSAVGQYPFCVTAFNPLSNRSSCLQEPLHVEKPPHGLTLDRQDYSTQPSNATLFMAMVTQGTNLTFNWTFGDEKELLNGGLKVSHEYLNTGRYYVKVTAKNKVGEQLARATVYVEHVIQGVDIRVGSRLVATDERVTFTAYPYPRELALERGLPLVNEYHWDFDNNHPQITYTNTTSHAYRYIGNKTVTVRAHNHVSNATSQPVNLLVIAKLGEVVIGEPNDVPMVNESMRFVMYSYMGSNLNYSWNLGDGTIKQTRGNPEVAHTFTRVGEYEIVGCAKNALSNATARRTVFIMERLCLPPVITMLTTHPYRPIQNNQRQLQILRSEEVKVEVDVKVNCSITMTTTYRWMVVNEESGELANVLHARTLYLPPRSLDYGNYSIHLQVRMVGTIVNTNRTRHIAVVPSTLCSVIDGGILREVSKRELISLDGSKSRDLDFPESSDMSYNWTCYPLKFPSNLCFSKNFTDVLKQNSSSLIFPGQYLNVTGGHEEFLFNLTVIKPGRRSDVSSQLLRITDATRWLDVKISCPACRDVLVNANERLAMEAVCDNCRHDDEIEYSWVTEQVRSEVESDPGELCEVENVPDKSGRALRLNTNHGILPQSFAQPQHQVSPAQNNASAPGSSKTTTTTIFPGPFIPQEVMSEGRGNRGRRQAAQTDRDPASGQDPQPAGSAGSSSWASPRAARGSGRPQTSRFGPMREPVADESAPSGRGPPTNDDHFISLTEVPGSGRNVGMPDSVHENTGTNPRGEQNKNSATAIPPEPSAFPVYDTVVRSGKSDPSLLELSRKVMVFDSNATSTGYNNRAFVVQPGTLKQGKVYVFTVLASKKGDPSVKGIAYMMFEVNRSPDKGQCVIPDSQRERMELTEWLRVYCREWKDPGHEPLTYEVGYRLSEDPGEAYNLIYRGMNTDMNFALPAGKGHNHIVCVHVVITDKLGAKTEACVIRLTVRPRPREINNNNNETVESQLYNEVTRNDTKFGKFLSQQDDGYARLYSNYFALFLNRLDPAPLGSEASRLRTATRQTLLHVLNSFTIRDEYEILQTLQAVVQLTEIRTELDGAALELATILLEKIAGGARELYKDYVAGDLLRYIVQAGSNIMAVTDLDSEAGLVELSTSHPTIMLTTPDTTFPSIAAVIEALLQGQLETHYIGEAAIQWSSSYISVFANRYDSMAGPVIKTNEASCSLPRDMGVVLNHPTPGGATRTSHTLTNENCYQAHMITFRENPFKRLDKTIKIQSEVTSLKVLDCYGVEVRIANLTENNRVKLEIPQKDKQNRSLVRHTLKKWQMNMHQFNITETNLNQSLHVHIVLEPVQHGRLFPISVLISCGAVPEPDSFMSKTEFTSTDNHLPLFLPAGTFNTTGVCYMALVDSAYNAGRPRPQEVRVREYSLDTWWGQCLFWDYTKNRWSGEGCYTTAMSTLDTTQCLCNHLTMFASRLDLVPNELSFANVEDFFDLYRSPVMFAFISAVLLSYFIAAIFCRRMDLHDARKGGVVYLQDNAVTDHQRYEITLETGFRKGAGTTAKISVILHGEEGMSETRELISEDERPLFERNSRDTFIMTLPDNIGRIWKIQLWHNNSGSSPSWFLSRATVRDINCETMFYFICEKWLAVEEDEGKVEGEFMSLEGNLGFKKVFWAKGTQYATDFHLWASLFTRPSYSRFTRLQRLSCCLTLLMSYMCLNAMWYRTSIEQYRGEFGLLDLSWRSVVVGAICCAIVLPVNMLIVFLFRRSKVAYRRHAKEDVYRTAKCEHGQGEEESEEAVPPVMTHSILDQSLLNWQGIQEWAQKQWVKRQQSVHTSTESVKPNLPPIQHTKKSEPLEQGSSGFEDCASQDRTHPTIQLKKSNSSQASSGSSSHTQPGKRGVSGGRLFLPSCCRYLAWALSVTIILGCAVITMLYGFRFGRTKSVMWLQSFYFSFMFCVFFSHPFLILLLSIYTAIRYRSDPSILDHHEDGFFGKLRHTDKKSKKKEIDCCEECEELERGVNARQRSRYLRFARPPQEKQLIEARKKIMKEKKAYSVLQDYWEFLMFFVVLCFMAFGKNLSSPYHLNETLKNVFVRSGAVPFSGVESVRDWWRWSQTGLLEGLFNQLAYDRLALSPSQNTNTFIIGHVHLRQLRVTAQQTCHPPTQNALFDTCHEDYASATRAVEPYGPNNTWRHRFYSQYYMLHGRHASYDSSGYVILLNKSRSEAYSQLVELYDDDWLDARTRAVIVEFTLFYAPTSLFTSVTLLLETPSTGGAFPYPSVLSTYLYRYISIWDNIILACELFFIIMVLYCVKCVVVEAIKLRSSYLHNPWNIIDVVSSLMSLAYLGCYVYRFVLVYETKEHLLSTYYEQFVDLSTLARWDEILKAMVGFLLFIVVCKFLHLLRYKKTFSTLGNFYKRAYRELLVFSAMFLGLLLAFTSLGYALFGFFSPNFRDFWVGLETMTGLLIGCHEFPEFDLYSLIGAKLFIVVYLITVVGLFTSYMVAVLSYQYKVYRQGEMIAMGCSDTMKFFWERFLLWAGFKRPPPDEEPDSQLPPEFTMAEIEYQVDELLFRMNAIAGSSNLPEKPRYYFTDSDVTYGVGDDGISSAEDSQSHGFDEERFEQRILKIEENLYGREPYLAQLIKLDSIGADLLLHDREKQLRSHLELEIFRRLQMQRQDLRSLRSSNRSSSSAGSSQPSPTGEITTTRRSLTQPVLKTASSPDVASETSPEKHREASNQSKLLGVLVPDEKSWQAESSTEVHTGAFPEDLIREALGRDIDVSERDVPLKSSSHKGQTNPKNNSLSVHSSCSDASKHSGKGTATTSSEDNTQVTGAGARAKVKHGGQPKVKPEIATPNSAKVFSHSSLRDLPPIEITKTSLIDSPRLVARLPPRGLLSLVTPQGLRPSESSSGSEQDGHRTRRPASKARTLRKTKSRGKGKGGSRLPTLESLEDDLLFDNCGYNTDNTPSYGSTTSDSSKDKSTTGSSSSDTKQAWL